MNADAQKVRSIFLATVENRAPDQWAAFLEEACAGDQDLRRRVEILLRAHQQPNSLLDSPASTPVATVDEPSVRERPGMVIGPYKLLEQIGEGGFGVVFMAEQTQPLRRKVALKVLKPGMDTRQVVARFEAERQALALMDHANIAHVFDGGETASGRPYFVMELVRGVPITDFCDQGRLPIRARLELFIDVCQAVRHAHQKGVIHRDIKPSNVLVMRHDDRAVVKVIDFGIAKAAGQQLTDKTLFTNFAQMIGTPLYMSPEQAGQSGLDVDTRSDIYSLGVLLYELLTGTTPFDQERLRALGYDEIRRIIREEEPARPSTRLSTLGQAAPTVSANRKSDPKRLSQLFRGELDWVVMKALEKDRNRRYDTAGALTADVQRYLADEPVLACPPSRLYRLHKFARRNRTALAFAGSVLFFIVSLGAGAGWAVRDRVARDHDQQVREAVLDVEASHAVDEAAGLTEQGNWPEALAAVGRADKLLESAGRAERPPRLLGLLKDLSMAQRLEDTYRSPQRDRTPALVLGGTDGIRRGPEPQQGSAEEEFFWGREQDARFAREFQDFGIDIDALETAEATARIGRTSIRPALVKALDEWAMLRRRARGDEDPGWKKLVETARQADPDEWRNRFRAALLGRDRQALEKLADSIPIRDVPPTTLFLLGTALKELGALEKAMTVLRQSQRQYPDDLWINDQLAYFSHTACRPPRYEDALRHYMIVLALRPRQRRIHRAVAEVLEAQGALDDALAQYGRAVELDPKDPGAHNDFGRALDKKGRLDEAIAEFREALRLNDDAPEAHNGLGVALAHKGRLDEAVAEFREAVRRRKNSSAYHTNLGLVLRMKGNLDEAIAEFRGAIQLNKDFPSAHSNLGLTLAQKGQLDEAVAECREALRLEPDYAEAHNNLGMALRDQGRLDEAVAEHREALRLKKDFADANFALGVALACKGQLDEAIPEFRKALRLKKDNPVTHLNLGTALRETGQVAEAVVEFREAIRLGEDNARTRHDLGAALRDTGQLAEAVAEFRRALEVMRREDSRGQRNPPWAHAKVEVRLRQAEQMARLDERLPAVLQGKDQPGDAAERLAFARLCQLLNRKQYVAAAGFYADAFAAEPKLAEDLQATNRYDAVRAAARAGCGQGQDAGSLDAKERARLRRQALDWLRADLEACGGQLDKEPARARGLVAHLLPHWLTDPDLAGVRGPEALARLPQAERQPWQKLWDDVAGVLARAQGKAAPEKNSATK